jgi:uncharacterized protein YjbI with pentapeptide repeats
VNSHQDRKTCNGFGPHEAGTIVKSTISAQGAPPRRPEHMLTRLEKATLRELRVRDSSLDWVDFADADLRGSRFENVSLVGCDFGHADLRRVHFVRCDLQSASFSGAIFGDNSFSGCCLCGAVGISGVHRDYIRQCGGSFFEMISESGKSSDAPRIDTERDDSR